MRFFRDKAREAVEDQRLQDALENATGRFRDARVEALGAVQNVEEMRDHLKRIRSATLSNLGENLKTFERNAIRAGANVHWAKDGGEAAGIVLDIAQSKSIELVVKSKSMTTEEISLNEVLIGNGIETVETDLGEWIIQLAGDPPSHIIAPAVHMTKEEVAKLFEEQTGTLIPADIPLLTAEARRLLREKFLSAGMGISGANLLVAETGSVVVVTNEGNGRMVTSLPPVHVVIVGIEKVAPTWEEAAVWLSLLARNATGQPLSIYTNIITGPAKAEDVDGPIEVHIILLDNGRSRILNSRYKEVLQCIRCGACLNICPVYREAGGHAYGSPYSGPIGAVISPLLFGLEKYPALPQASSLCYACLEVCPVRIDLPGMLLALRQEEVERRILPWHERTLERFAGWVMGKPGLYRWGVSIAKRLRIASIIKRFIPFKLPQKTFYELWKNKEEGKYE